MATIEPSSSGQKLVALLNRVQVPQQAIAIQYHCQASMALKAAGKILYIDPWYSDYLDQVAKGQPFESHRLYPAPLAPADVTNADYIFVTHDHIDHLDPSTIPIAANASPQAHFIAPQAARAHLLSLGVSPERITAIRIPENEILSSAYQFDAFSLTAIRGDHDGFDYDQEHGYPWLGYILNINGLTFLHAGDTKPYDGQAEMLHSFAIDVACLPINGGTYRTRSKGFKGNFTYKEAADLGVTIEADWIIPIHYGALSDNDEKGSRFVDYIEERYPFQKFHLLRQGETILYHRWEN